MVARKRGPIVHISFCAARKYIGNCTYGIAKAATDKMSADMLMNFEKAASASCRYIQGS